MRKIFIFLLFTLTSFATNAQQTNTANVVQQGVDTVATVAPPHYYVPRDYSFIKYDLDTLYFSLDTSLLVPFFHKFNYAKYSEDANLHIVHIGGSHVQGGMFPHTIRREIILHHDTCAAERGLIFPYSVAPRCNNPYDYTLSDVGKFGLIRNVYEEHKQPLQTFGIAVYTGDTTAQFTIGMNDDDIPFTFNKISLLATTDSLNSIPTICVDTNEFFPNSIDTVKNRYIYDLPFETDSFTVKCNIILGDTMFFFGIYLDNELPGITFHSLGVNGASVDSYLRCEKFTNDLDLIIPDMVIFGLGINDATHSDFTKEKYEENYLQLVQLFQNVNPDCAFVFLTNNDSFTRKWRGGKPYYEVNERALDVREVMYSLAAKTRGAVFDQFEIMGGLRSMKTWYDNKLAKKDRVHFTNKGYELMGKLFFEAFDKAYHKVMD